MSRMPEKSIEQYSLLAFFLISEHIIKIENMLCLDFYYDDKSLVYLHRRKFEEYFDDSISYPKTIQIFLAAIT